MKTCSVCKIEKPAECFGKSARIKDGLRGQCKSCVNAASAVAHLKNQEASNARRRDWYRRNKTARNKTQKQWRDANREKLNAESRQKYAIDPSATKAAIKKWTQANPHRAAATTAKYRAAKRNRTPKWLTPTQLKAIQDIYEQAAALSKLTGCRYEVDHVVPLQGKKVSGLHVPWNLQIIPVPENRRKRNRWEP